MTSLSAVTRRPTADALDAIAWTIVSFAVLAAMPIGWVSGDALDQGARYVQGRFAWDPNHLLLEPIGALWIGTLSALGWDAHFVDGLKLLSAVAGAVAIGLFRGLVAARIASNRVAANFGTCWVALGSAFLRMWISGEAYMLQMPFLVGAAIGIERHIQLRRARWALVAGAGFGLASLFFVSNLVLALTAGVVLCAYHVWGGRRRVALVALTAVGIGAAVTAAAALIPAWALTGAGDQQFLTWLTSYAGGALDADRALARRGIAVDVAQIVRSLMRMGYGSGGVIVDLAPVVETLRDETGTIDASAIARLLSFLAGVGAVAVALCTAFRARATREATVVWLLIGTWTMGIGTFMAYWDNSDAQFYFQYAIPLGALMCQVSRGLSSRVVFVASAVALTWNLGDVWARYVSYPRWEKAEKLGAVVRDASLILYPGTDEVEHLLFFAPGNPRQRALSLTTVASRYSPPEGARVLRDTVRATAAGGGTVYALDLFNVPPRQHPWKGLEELGYTQSSIAEVLRTAGRLITSQDVDGITVTRIQPGDP